MDPLELIATDDNELLLVTLLETDTDGDPTPDVSSLEDTEDDAVVV